MFIGRMRAVQHSQTSAGLGVLLLLTVYNPFVVLPRSLLAHHDVSQRRQDASCPRKRWLLPCPPAWWNKNAEPEMRLTHAPTGQVNVEDLCSDPMALKFRAEVTNPANVSSEREHLSRRFRECKRGKGLCCSRAERLPFHPP